MHEARLDDTSDGPEPKSSASAATPAMAPRWQDVLSPEERRELLQVDVWPGLRSLAFNWTIIAASFALVAWQPHPLTIVAALFLIGARQLGLAILMHEAAHRTLLPQRAWNDRLGNWLAAYPIWADTAPYRAYHLVHHAKTGSAEDPDLKLVEPFPITRASLLRKVLRDLSGRTGLKQAKDVLLRDLGWSTRPNQRSRSVRAGRKSDVGWHKLAPVAITNGALIGVLALLGHTELYLLWAIAWLTTYRLCTRIRSIAEHALAPDREDPLRNTRTTLARWWERLLIAPNFVNYHLEHHLLMTVPHDKLPRLHRLLRDRGVLANACIAPSYLSVLRAASSAAPARDDSAH